MAKKTVGDINYRVVFINAAISAVATATTMYFINKMFKNTGTGGMGIALKTFAFLPLQEQARFADAVTMQKASDHKWLVEQFANIDPSDPNTYKNANMTSIGNCAFIALYGVHEGIKGKCKQLIENFKNLA